MQKNDIIDKRRVYPTVDVVEERSRGVSSGAAFLKVKMRQLYAPAPPETKECREIYVRCAERIVASFLNVKSVAEFILVRNSIRNELTRFQDPQSFQKYSDCVGRRFLKFLNGGFIYNDAKFYESSNNWKWAE